MNDFLQRYARQSHDLAAAKIFLAIDDADDRTIYGFYMSAIYLTLNAEWQARHCTEIACSASMVFFQSADVG